MTEHAPTPEKHMKRTERLIRGIGGYTLGFLGIGAQAHGIATLNPFSFALGTGLAYAAHRVMDPYYNDRFGAPTHERSKLSRFARFNAALIPTYVGASLLNAAIFGGFGLSGAERLVEGAIGVPVLGAGLMVEHRMHTGEQVLNHHAPAAEVHNEAAQLHEAQPPHPDQGFSMRGLYNRVKSAAVSIHQRIFVGPATPRPSASVVVPTISPVLMA